MARPPERPAAPRLLRLSLCAAALLAALAQNPAPGSAPKDPAVLAWLDDDISELPTGMTLWEKPDHKEELTMAVSTEGTMYFRTQGKDYNSRIVMTRLGLFSLHVRNKLPTVHATFTSLGPNDVSTPPRRDAPAFCWNRPVGAKYPLLWPEADTWGWPEIWIAPHWLVQERLREEQPKWGDREGRIEYTGGWGVIRDQFAACAEAHPERLVHTGPRWGSLNSGRFQRTRGDAMKPAAWDMRKLLRRKLQVYLYGASASSVRRPPPSRRCSACLCHQGVPALATPFSRALFLPPPQSFKRIVSSGAAPVYPTNHVWETLAIKAFDNSCKNCSISFNGTQREPNAYFCAKMLAAVDAHTDAQLEEMAGRAFKFGHSELTFEMMELYMHAAMVRLGCCRRAAAAVAAARLAAVGPLSSYFCM